MVSCIGTLSGSRPLVRGAPNADLVGRYQRGCCGTIRPAAMDAVKPMMSRGLHAERRERALSTGPKAETWRGAHIGIWPTSSAPLASTGNSGSVYFMPRRTAYAS